MARPLHSSAPCCKFFSNIHANSFCSLSLCIHHFVLSLAILSLPFLVLVIQWLCVLYWEESLFHLYHCLVNWTNISCSVFPYFQVLPDVLVLYLMFSFHVLMLCTSLLSFHLQSACTFSKSILRFIHEIVKITVSYIACVSLCPLVCTEKLDSHWAHFCEIFLLGCLY